MMLNLRCSICQYLPAQNVPHDILRHAILFGEFTATTKKGTVFKLKLQGYRWGQDEVKECRGWGCLQQYDLRLLGPSNAFQLPSLRGYRVKP